MPPAHHPAAEPPYAAAPFAGLSSVARTAWAKHHRPTDDWLPLWRHMADSAAAAGRLWDRWLPRSVKELMSQALPEGEADTRRLAVFVAASHDVGKASPAFACQVDGLADRMRSAGLEMRTAKQYGPDRRMAPHGLVGQQLIQEWLAERYGFRGRTAGQFAVIAGGHHGVPPEHQQIHDLNLRPQFVRHPGDSEPVWRRVQFELLDHCAELSDANTRFEDWKGVRLPQTAQVTLTALVILADWIASASELFPYDPASWLPAGPASEARRLEAAWRGLDLPGPWAATDDGASPAELFASRFDLPDGAEIREVQAEALRLARTMPTPGLLMIEAPMGEGKTEAALAAAEVFAARSGAGGCLVALPTRATGDAMFPRLLGWLERLPHDGPRSVALAHAKAALNDMWAGLLQEGNRAIGAVDADADQRITRHDGGRQAPPGLHAHQWLRGRKKQLLASFAVGTVDQVLFAGLKSRHLALRHLAVAGKVVIIDEVHAYDAYMSRYLDRVLEWLAAYRVPVVLLSATLPGDRRRALAAAYGGSVASLPEEAAGSTAYPLLTAVAPEVPGARHTAVLCSTPAPAAGRDTVVTLERLDDEVSSLVQRLTDELVDGGCALVVRNTVKRVQEAADALRSRFGEDVVTVTHSRFVDADRAAKDVDLRERFGPDGTHRPGRHIVVGSQVVEQSLDVDFDLLVTDLAPVDLMLQRMGRLHRHPRSRPERLAAARCLVTGVEDWASTPPLADRGSLFVYRAHPLLRAAAVLEPHLDGKQLRLPEDISPLVQAAYGAEPVGPGAWADAMHEAAADQLRFVQAQRDAARGFLLDRAGRDGRPLYGWLQAHAGDADESPRGRAQVRDTEDSLQVLVVRRMPDGRLTTLPWLDGGRGGLELSTDFPPEGRPARALAACALTLPPYFSQPWMVDRVIAELERFMVPAWQVKECPLLAGELLLVLDEDCQTRLADFDLVYDRFDGLRVTTTESSGREGAHRAEAGGHGEGLIEVSPEAEREQQAAGAAAASDGSGGEAVTEVSPAPSFDLVDRPWLLVQREDGTTGEVSLREVFAQARTLRRLVGDLPTQEFALLRLLLAVLYDALDGPAELEDWEELWQADDPFAPALDYLDEHRDRFDLLHPQRPFFQVAGLRTAKDEVSSLNRIVADVPNGEPFFAMRRPGAEELSFAEAARWLVHTHAYDPSGIKSGMVDDSRAKAGKVYPLGVGSVGMLGGLHAEGNSLHETLLLNLIPLRENVLGGDEEVGGAGVDLPAWRREGWTGGAWQPPAGQEQAVDLRPHGPIDLYTWQSRRVRLHVEGDAVTGVVLGYGDPLESRSPWTLEPMTGWRRSPTQEKKRGRPLYYMPRAHDPSRAAWRGLASLLPSRGSAEERSDKGAADALVSGVVRWNAMLATEGDLELSTLIRLRLIGVVYGTQQSVIDEVLDDSVVLPVIVLHEEGSAYRGAALDAVKAAEEAVRTLGFLAGNLARAAGADPEPATDTARDLGFGALDGPYRAWLARLGGALSPEAAQDEWRARVRRIVTGLADQLLADAGETASEGRIVDLPKVGPRWLNDARAELLFRRELKRVLPPPPVKKSLDDDTPKDGA
ncbi:type I-E CRISPR-associated protein Cse1/CasA [Streptomyces sp. LE64]|uniref:type I-E CRISPR-associated protein Cse1/CasA n=1 Tax=Streptomyces sp. LE64 TaxID=3448653 RepID=UPI0040433EA9